MNAGKIRALKKRGFALIAALVIMVLLTITVVAFLGLSTIQLRQSGPMLESVQARSNARMALGQALGQLQKWMGPDRRVSAAAEITGDDLNQPHWTGAWRSAPKSADSWLTRDDANGGLKDSRVTDKSNPAALPLGWLVSGSGAPASGPTAASIDLVSAGKTGGKAVAVETVPIQQDGKKVAGHVAWWTGDLGIRANVQVPDAHEKEAINPGSPSQDAYARVLASQRVDESVLSGDKSVAADARARLASDGSVSLGVQDQAWSKTHFLDFTTASSGVLADVNHGGLKKDLTAYFDSTGSISDRGDMRGLNDEDLLVGQEPEISESTRSQKTGARFGLLRKWAKAQVSFSGTDTPSVLPETIDADKKASVDLALSNEQTVKLQGNHTPSLQPILVEATNYTQVSTYSLGPAFYQLRSLLYPRVVMWNPYNVSLKSQRSIIVIQGNGRQEMWTESPWGGSMRQDQWLNFEGGRSTSFNLFGGREDDPGYNDPYMGSYYFSLPETVFAPGECLVFSPAKSAEYDGLSAYRPGPYNLAANELSCTVSPDPSRSYYVSASDISGGINFRPVYFWYAPTPAWSLGGRNGVENQGDDTRAILKAIPEGTRTVTFESFDALPQLCVLSASLQYGAGKEPRIAWNQNEKMPVETLAATNPRPTLIPNVRTREGLRMRWFDEHRSNLLGSGGLANTPYFEDAIIANWNPRAAFNVRSPWENIGGSLPTSGSAGGPWFFGAYTRDLFDQAVSWQDETPVPSGGKFHGNPFGPPQEGKSHIVLFDIPRTETGVISLGQLQHAQLSNFIWHPSYAIGNSLVDPRLGLTMDHTAATSEEPDGASKAGFDKHAIGWSSDKQRSDSDDAWASTGRAILQETPDTDNLVYDLSYEANRTLWDRYYLSSGSAEEKELFAKDPAANPLPNGRLRLTPGGTTTAEQLTDFHEAAAHLMVSGAFNVNSTRVEAWKALLASTRKSGFGGSTGTPFPRVLNPPGHEWTSSNGADSDDAWSGFRSLSDAEIDQLATEIVKQVKLRGPFLSLADFVNRRLTSDETGRMGPLQAAIEKAGLNKAFSSSFPLDNTQSLPDYKHPDNIRDATRMEQTLKPDSKAWGVPGYLTQADVLQVLGPALSARSDTFVIRAYGDATDAEGKVKARAWCEAVVQRVPQPVKADSQGLNPVDPDTDADMGRRFELVSFRWLNKDEL